MRFPEQNTSFDQDSPNTGSLLIAHPAMLDPNFQRTVVFIAAHNSEEGSLGLVMNRPLGESLGESKSSLSNSPLAGIPLYEGGPVAQDKLILAAWRWVAKEGTFQLFFGIDESKAEQLLAEGSGFQVRGFMGHAGWSEGQLNAELEQGTWLVSKSLPELIRQDGELMWRSILIQHSPLMHLLADAPDDPSLN